MYENDYTYNAHSENRPVGPGPDMRFDPNPEKPPKKNNMGMGKKIVMMVCLGLFFGVFGGLGFMAATSATEIIRSGMEQAGLRQKPQTEEVIEATGEAESDVTEAAAPAVSVEEVEAGNYTAVVTDVTDVVNNVMPAVVSVNNNYTETYQYFGREFSNEGQASGSGIIIGENETEILIVSNYHVVYENDMLEVLFVDGSMVEAQVKGSDPSMDLTVLAVALEDISNETRKSIAVAKLGDSDSLMVGEPAIAIGNAMGYGQSVTTGVVSALDRESSYYNGESEVNTTFIQTDAAINPGNSGGALLNIKGEVIGINSNKVGGDLIEGMGYAIPISAARPIIEELMLMETRIAVEEAERGYLGIYGMTVDAEYSEVFNIPQGVFITDVFAGTGAEAAGLKYGDIITEFDGVEIYSMETLQKRLSFYQAGESVTLIIMSGDAMGGYEEKEVDIVLGEQPTETAP